MSRSVDWYLTADVSGQPVFPIFEGEAVKDEAMYFKSRRTLRAMSSVVKKTHCTLCKVVIVVVQCSFTETQFGIYTHILLGILTDRI
jgi:hypothetical protein